MNSTRKLDLLRALLIVTMGAWSFSPALRGNWFWDDSELITQNALVHDPAGPLKLWFQGDKLGEYLPLTVDVQWLEWHFWQINTLGYHLVNLLLHLGSALLVWRLFDKLGLRLAWLGGLLFAIHPLMVESVAWISELKNTLSLPPFLLAMCAWIDYDERGRRRDYVLALALFFFAMLCKTTMALFPAVILLYVWWKRGRIGWVDLKAGAVFLGVSLVLGLIAILVQEHDIKGVTPPWSFDGIMDRAALAGQSIPFYISKIFLPFGLIPIYPDQTPFSPVPFFAGVLIAGMACWFWSERAGWGRHALLGLGFFLINLVPVFGIIAMKYTVMVWSMDHMVYIPIIGVIGLVVAALGQLEARLPAVFVRPGTVLFAVVVALFALKTHSYATLFQDEKAIWTYTLERNPNAWPAHANLANYLIQFEPEHIQEAIEQFRITLQLNPHSVVANNNLGFILLGLPDRTPEETAEAIDHFNRALQVDPNFARAHINLGDVFAKTGHIPEAIAHYKRAMEINPDDAETRKSLEKLLAAQKAVP